MSSTSEQGHNKNTVNFEKLIITCTSFGSSYNPTKEALKLTALQTQLDSANTCIADVKSLTPAYKNAVTARRLAFKPFDELITRVNNALKASDTPTEFDESAQTLVRKLKGTRAKPKKTEDQKKAMVDAGKELIEISTSQMSYDNRIDNFDKLIKLISSVPQYAPNETDLKIESLTAVYNDLKSRNLSVIIAESPINSARILRNDIMYKDITGLIDIASDVKTYVKSVFGATSPQYKQVSGLKFIKYNN
jgi:hypothetical protein